MRIASAKELTVYKKSYALAIDIFQVTNGCRQKRSFM